MGSPFFDNWHRGRDLVRLTFLPTIFFNNKNRNTSGFFLFSLSLSLSLLFSSTLFSYLSLIREISRVKTFKPFVQYVPLPAAILGEVIETHLWAWVPEEMDGLQSLLSSFPLSSFFLSLHNLSLSLFTIFLLLFLPSFSLLFFVPNSGLLNERTCEVNIVLSTIMPRDKKRFGLHFFQAVNFHVWYFPLCFQLLFFQSQFLVVHFSLLPLLVDKGKSLNHDSWILFQLYELRRLVFQEGK